MINNSVVTQCQWLWEMNKTMAMQWLGNFVIGKNDNKLWMNMAIK